jgi:hypothetical protein
VTWFRGIFFTWASSRSTHVTTVTPGQITLAGPQGLVPVIISGVPGSNNSQFDVTFAPQTAAGSSYALAISTGVHDQDGNPLATAYSIQFTVTVATFVVTSLTDSGPGSLREAIAYTASGGTVDFQPGLRGTITLTSGRAIASCWQKRRGHKGAMERSFPEAANREEHGKCLKSPAQVTLIQALNCDVSPLRIVSLRSVAVALTV